MKTTLPTLLLTLLLTFGAIALPTATAEPGLLASSALAMEDLTRWPKCYPAAVGSVCVSPYWPGCNVWVVWTAAPIPPTCLYSSDPPTTSSADSESTPPPCYEVYSQTHLGGGYWLVRRNSCSAQVYQCPPGYSPPAPPCEEVGLRA